jgi:hypothetical protein
MRILSGFSDPVVPASRLWALFLAAMTPSVWGVASLTVGMALLVRGLLLLLLSAPQSLVLTPLVLTCRSWHWRWLCREEWFLEPWSWLCRCWFCWPWLCWKWIR